MIKNVGKFDRTMRLFLAVFMIWFGLFYLSGHWLGIVVALLSLIPITMVLTGSCPVFKWFNFHSLSKKEFEKYGNPYEKNL